MNTGTETLRTLVSDSSDDLKTVFLPEKSEVKWEETQAEESPRRQVLLEKSGFGVS